MKKFFLIFCVITLQTLCLSAYDLELINGMPLVSAISKPLLESEIFHLVNQHRISNSLPRLRWASSPAHQARKHSLNMANGKVPFGHDGVDLRYAAIQKIIPSITRFGENVAYNIGHANPAQVAFEGWLQSPGHYANIMGDYNLAGVGVALNAQGAYYFTQIFVKANPASILNEGIEEESCSKAAYIYETPVQIKAGP